MKRIFFFAKSEDIKPVLSSFEANAPLKFIPAGKRSTANRPIYLESSELLDLGIATAETGSASTTYIVSLHDTKNVLYTFDDDEGQRQWLLSNGDNEETVLFTPAGLWKTGTLLPGNMSTLHNTIVAQQLMRWFLQALKQEHFIKIESWWLGSEAFDMLKTGKRLTTTAEQSPPQFDLKWPTT